MKVSEPKLEAGNRPCLLCESHKTSVVGRLAAPSLADAYRSDLGLTVDFPVDELFYVRCNGCDLLFFSPPLTGDARFYGELQKIPWYYSAGKQEFHIAAKYVERRHRILEIGAGRGMFATEISPMSYTGLEFSPTAIQLAAERGIRLLSEPIEQHAISNAEQYDVVCSFQVLEHVAAPRAFLEAAATCLRPGGRLVVSVPGEDSFARFAYWDVLNMPPHHVTRWTDTCLRSIARLIGMQLIALTPEPLGRNMVRHYAKAMADHRLAELIGVHPVLLDVRLRRPMFQVVSNMIAACMRHYLKASRGNRRGHAVLAIFEK